MATATQTAKPTKGSTPETAQAVATQGPKTMTVDPRNANVPDYIKQGAARGNENVAVEDIVIPRIEIVQALSPALKPNDPDYIEGAKQGDLYNSVTRELYGSNVTVIPVFFKKQYLNWRDRKKGGGFGGAYDTIAEAIERIKKEENAEEWEPTETAQQLCLVLRSDGGIDEAVVSMNRTKLKVSRQWNSLIRLNGNDRFSRTYSLFTVDEKNGQGQDYKNFAVVSGGFPSEHAYRKAEALYAALSTGARKMNVDISDQGDESSGSAASKEY